MNCPNDRLSVRTRLRRLFSPIARLLSPGYSKCERCRMPWSFVNYHLVAIDEYKGCFSLCRQCWAEVDVLTRIAYFDQARLRDWPNTSYEEIEEAVARASIGPAD